MTSAVTNIFETSLSDVLNDFLKINNVLSAAIVGRDGFVIESSSNIDVDADALGAMVATTIGTDENLGKEFKLGDIDHYLSEFSGGKILMSTVQEDILLVFTDADAVVGSVRYEIKKRLPKVLHILQ